jgi:tetratricopeptide (TPR) repeat protein
MGNFMRDEIRAPNKIVWIIVGLVAFCCALLMTIVPKDQREPNPPFDLRLFLVAPPEQGFSVDKAIQEIKRNPENIDILLKLQQYYAYQAEWQKAIEIGEKILSSPRGRREGNAYLGIAYAWIYLGQLDKAQEWISKGLRTVVDNQQLAQLERVLGDILLLQSEAQRTHYELSLAELHYRQALQEWPQYAFARANLAYVKFRQGDLRSARELIQEVLQSPESTARDRAVALYYLAQIEEVSGNTAEAKRLYNQAKATHPESFVQK